MSKKYLVSLLAVMLMSGAAYAAVDGGYSSVRNNMMNNEAYSNVVNDYTFNETKNISDVIKEKDVVPASSHKSTYSAERERSYGFGSVDIPSSGVNNSKTIYTDEVGRLHFFGRANQIRY